MSVKSRVERLEKASGDRRKYVVAFVGTDEVYHWWGDGPEEEHTSWAELEELGRDAHILVYESNVDDAQI